MDDPTMARLLLKTRLPADGRCVVTFRDSTEGISQSLARDGLRVLYTTKSTRKNTGLRLSICSPLVSEHGGRIYAKKNTGPGATFTVELPVISQG